MASNQPAPPSRGAPHPPGPGHTRNGSYPYPQRQSSLSSESSLSSHLTDFSTTPRPHYAQHASAAASSSSISSTPRPTAPGHITPIKSSQQDIPLRNAAAATAMPVSSHHSRDRSRQHSQGFFEPSLPTASHTHQSSSGSVSGLSASQIAAQAAMHVQNPKTAGQDRRRSQTIPEPPPMARPNVPRQSSFPTPINTSQGSSRNNSLTSRTLSAGPTSAATTAANAAFPRSPLSSPNLLQHFEKQMQQSPVSEKDPKPGKEKSSRRKLFSKPNKIHVSKDKDADKKLVYTPGVYGSGYNQSTTSLADSITPVPSLYNNVNSSSSTLVPLERGAAVEKEREKEKHRHNFLSRQKNKLKDDHHNLPLSSAASNSRPADPNAPQSLYSFAPSSPGLGSKSISGLDLRHGGRALREKKKEEKEKAAAATFISPIGATGAGLGVTTDHASDVSTVFGPPSNPSTYDIGLPSQALSGFGLQNMSADDAWPLLRARLLNIFEGEDLRTPVEDFNRLVNVHLQRCVARRAPGAVVEDVRDLLRTGFTSLDQTLRGIPEDRIVRPLVDTWAFVFGTVLPFMQAVFLPLDLEFKGHGALVPAGEATDFWAAAAASTMVTSPPPKPTAAQAQAGGPTLTPRSNTTLDIRTLVLAAFRDVVLLPRYDSLLATFSRLSLDNMQQASAIAPAISDLPHLQPRPGTATSSSGPDPSSFNSQGSTLLDSSTASSLGARSRATSNTSAGSLHSAGSAAARQQRAAANSVSTNTSSGSGASVMDSGKVTETAARMLQCVSVLARLRGVEGEDVEGAARRKMEGLAKELKVNWLGRSRMGRERRGFVGGRVRTGALGIGVAA